MNRSSRASTRFLAEAFAVWCDQKSRLAGARAMGLLDDETHDALSEAYTRTRELIGALLARAEVSRTEISGGPDSVGPQPRERIAVEAAQSAALPTNGASGSLGGPDSVGPQPEERMAAGRRVCPAC